MEKFNPFKMAQQQFDQVADLLGLDTGTRDLLRVPMREYHFTIPVRMDDGGTKVFQGFRVQHNDAIGPSKGGVEMRRGGHPPWRRQGRGHLRSAQSFRSGAGTNLPRMGAPGGPQRGPAPGCARPRRHDPRPAYAVDAG